MAVQMHVAYSSIMRGVGVIAGVAYNCTNSALLSVDPRLLGAQCMDGSFDFAANFNRQNDELLRDPVRSTIRQIFLAKKYGCFPGTTTASCDAGR